MTGEQLKNYLKRNPEPKKPLALPKELDFDDEKEDEVDEGTFKVAVQIEDTGVPEQTIELFKQTA